MSNARKNIIAEAKGLIGGGGGGGNGKAAQTSRNSEHANSKNMEQAASRNSESSAKAGNSNLREEEELELRSGPLDASETAGSPRKATSNGKKAFVLGDVDANVRAFLDRMRHQESLNVTAPKLPTAKSFEGPSAVSLDYTTSGGSTTTSLSKVALCFMFIIPWYSHSQPISPKANKPQLRRIYVGNGEQKTLPHF